ncbi:unnamed protein product [Urochloa decumbens]|uniref:Uncharacterized protein n=1 Tax=Urochloa decumbens TaxID=240449 RepID=A0ABC9E9D7_9POAL
MAAAGSAAADKENAAPSTSTAAAGVPRRHGYGVRSCGVKKRPSRARLAGPWVPLRDITNLVAGTSAVAGPDSPLGLDASTAAAAGLAKPDVAAVPSAATTLDGAAGGAVAAKKAAAAPRYSLRKGFR